ncbi:MAG: methyl-accepting chemotaxis protein [Nitrospirota bacterium]|jgi:methyl-accepting chemotaxis protein
MAVLSAAAFYASVESYRSEAEGKLVQAHEALAGVLDMNRPGKRTLASLSQRRAAASWLAPWETLADVDRAFLTKNGKVVGAGSSAELPEALQGVAVAPVPEKRRVGWLPNPRNNEWLVLSLPMGSGDLVLHLARSRAALDADVRRFKIRQAIWAASSPVLSGMILFLLLGPSMRRLAMLASRLQRLGQGHFDVKLPVVGTGDIGRLEGVFNAAVWNLKTRLEKDADDKFRRQREIRDLEESIKCLRSGDLNVQITGQSVVLKRVYEVFNLTVQELREFLYSLRENTNVMSERTRHVMATGREVTVRENEQKIQLERLSKDLDGIAVNLNEVVSSVEQEQESLAFLASITETGEGSVMQVVTDIYGTVDEGSKQVSHKIHDLEQQSHEIGKMTELITELAGQTNLLSLNAALEASRVGEQGRGFAAVADEIRKLAVKVTESAGEIQSMVETVVNDSSDALGLLDRSGAEMAGSKVMVEAALASLTDLVESARSARQNSSTAHETLIEMTKVAGGLRNSVGQMTERANTSVNGLNSLGDAMSTVTRIAEESVKRLNRLQISAPVAVSRKKGGESAEGGSPGAMPEDGTASVPVGIETSPSAR